jgi:AraC-like DNA-binding protein
MDKETDVPDFLSRALSYINENYREKIVAENLAHKVGVGRTTLMNSFRKHLGLPFSEYVAKCRLFSAVNLLKSGKSVSETAELSGFTESSNFIRSFKKYFGQTPAKYLGSISGD